MRASILCVLLAMVSGCDASSGDDAGPRDAGSMDARGDGSIDVGPGELATSITQYGITWTFDRAYPTGTYVTGDPWVVGPVTIIDIAPTPGAGRNGSVVNPTGGHQGYDDRGGEYDDSENITLPLVLSPDQSLVSSISKPEGVEIRNVGCLRAQAVLTAVAAPVAATAFRPGYAGSYKRTLDASALRMDLLPALPPPATAPDLGDLVTMLDRPRIDHLSSWTIQDSCAEENWNNGEGAHACYGREVATVFGDAALAVLIDDPDRDALVLALVQHGIDNYSVLRAGGHWPADGGHHNARKWPIVFAARMLDDCDMLAVGLEYDGGDFGEDGHTYVGMDGTALFGSDCGGGRGRYFEDGCMGGGARDCRDPAGLVDACPDYRDCCTSAYWVGEALAARLLDATAIWNHDPFFDYVDRWMAGDVSGDADTSSAFVSAMWAAHRGSLPSDLPAPRTCD